MLSQTNRWSETQAELYLLLNAILALAQTQHDTATEGNNLALGLLAAG